MKAINFIISFIFGSVVCVGLFGLFFLDLANSQILGALIITTISIAALITNNSINKLK